VQSTRPSKVYVIYCDSEINHIDEFNPNDDLIFKLYGGGGTAFKPVFDHVIEKDIHPVCLVYLTDLYGDTTFAQPDYPVMWGCTTSQVAPWGETIPVEV
jgi:predicted metal-dependent peptidase